MHPITITGKEMWGITVKGATVDFELFFKLKWHFENKWQLFCSSSS